MDFWNGNTMFVTQKKCQSGIKIKVKKQRIIKWGLINQPMNIPKHVIIKKIHAIFSFFLMWNGFLRIKIKNNHII
jgi:hypothetical protein